MNQPIIKAAAFSLLCVFFSKISYSQTAAPDSVSKYANEYAVKYFEKNIGRQSRLFNGEEYRPYDPIIKSNPYFLDLTDMSAGTVKFDGFTYSNVPMMYDLYKDEVVALLYNRFSKYVLQSEHVSFFDIEGHHFVYISKDTTANPDKFRTGFYDQLYGGKTRALATYVKTLQNTSDFNGVTSYFTTTGRRLYIQKGNNYYAVSGQSDVLDVLKDKKKELQQYIKSNHIRYRKAPVEALVSITAYYDHLTN